MSVGNLEADNRRCQALREIVCDMLIASAAGLEGAPPDRETGSHE